MEQGQLIENLTSTEIIANFNPPLPVGCHWGLKIHGQHTYISLGAIDATQSSQITVEIPSDLDQSLDYELHFSGLEIGGAKLISSRGGMVIIVNAEIKPPVTATTVRAAQPMMIKKKSR